MGLEQDVSTVRNIFLKMNNRYESLDANIILG